MAELYNMEEVAERLHVDRRYLTALFREKGGSIQQDAVWFAFSGSFAGNNSGSKIRDVDIFIK